MFPVRHRIILVLFLAGAFLIQNILVYTDSGGRRVQLSELAKQGRALYHAHNCQSCHQLYGYGGPLGPDLTNIARRLKGPMLDDRLGFIMTKGNMQMPAFNFEPDEIAALKQYFLELDQSGLSQPSAYRPFTPDLESYIDAAADLHPMPAAAVEGRRIVESRCASCHLPYNEFGSGPTLLGVTARLGPEATRQIVTDGRPDKGMPDMATNRITADDVPGIVAYLEWLSRKDVVAEVNARWQTARDEHHKQEYPIPWWTYPDIERGVFE